MTRRTFQLMLLFVLLAPAGWTEEVAPSCDSEDPLQRIDGLLERGRAENYRSSGLALMKESLDLCLACMEEKATDYEILWRCSRAAHQYAETARNLEAEDWKATCKEWGKKGMEIAEKAQEVEPERVEGYFWQAACIGVYSDGTGVMTAVKEGFYNKSKTATRKAYELDKSYNDYDPVFAKAMFYITLPFPMKNKKKALAYFREFEENTAWEVRPYVRRLYGANLLMEAKPKGYREEAKGLLDYVLKAPHLQKYYRDWADELETGLK
jgi:hypothetical protein